MFIVKKKIGGQEYYYLRKSERRDGKVVAVTVAYLGKNKAEAERKAKEFADKKEVKVDEKKQKPSKAIPKQVDVEGMMAFCKRKGFVYQSAEIYGGFAGFWDFGHIGSELKNNLKKSWWKYNVHSRDDVVGIDGSIITNPEVWKASGHVESFHDVFVICKKCKKPGKVDKNEVGKVKCPCAGEYDWKSAKEFKLMFETDIGEKDKGYLRPETAQLIFTNFKSVYENARLKLPFGIAQVGKAFRNEIAPRDFLFRSREFEQMEIEYFIEPDAKCPYAIGNTEILVYSAEMQTKKKEPTRMKISQALKKGIIKRDWHAYWLEQQIKWFIELGANSAKFRIRQHAKDELSHYSSDTWDIEYNFPFGWKELEGIADRSDYDLGQHEKFSKTDLKVADEKGRKFLPHVVCEPSLGVERAFLVFMFDAYDYDSARDNIVLKLHPALSPIKAAVFPIIKKPAYEKIAKDIVDDLNNEFNILYDKSGSIGRRYSRNDEVGTPMCITVDEKSPKDKSVTIRDRDSTRQIRVKISELRNVVRSVVEGADLLSLGKEVKTRVK